METSLGYMTSGARRFFIGYVLITAVLPGCASNSSNALQKYQPPAPESPAAIIEVGKHGRAWSVDGTETPTFAKNIRLAPGEHQVGLNCLSYDVATAALVSVPATVGGAIESAAAAAALPKDMSISKLQFVLVTGRFEAGRTYYSRCVVVDGRPQALLADSPDGAALPQGFTVLCTRECPN